MIADIDGFERWVKHRPDAWGRAITCRVALRVLPLALTERFDRSFTRVFRAASIAFAANHLISKDFVMAGPVTGFDLEFVAASVDRNALVGPLPSSSDVLAVLTMAGAAFAAMSHGAVPSMIACVNRAIAAAKAINAAPQDLWDSISGDRQLLEAQNFMENPAKAIVEMPLWPNHTPMWFNESWQVAQRTLLRADPSHDLWQRWFERRIEGHSSAFALPADTDARVQSWLADRTAQQDKGFWERDAAEINRDIQRTINELAPLNIPAQHPHELQTFARDGRVARMQAPLHSDNPAQDLRRRDAWNAIRKALDDYMNDGPANNLPRLNRMIDRLAAALGNEFADFNPIGLGVQAEYLQQFALRADELLMADRAADLVALNTTVGALLPQFDEWLAYIADADIRHEVPPEALAAARQVADAIRLHDAAEAEVNSALSEMGDDAADEERATDPEMPAMQTYRKRFLGGLSNVLATAGQIALDFIKTKVAAVDKGINKGLESAGERGTMAVFISIASYLSVLAGAYPPLAYLTPLLALLRNNTPKS